MVIQLPPVTQRHYSVKVPNKASSTDCISRAFAAVLVVTIVEDSLKTADLAALTETRRLVSGIPRYRG